MRHLKLRRADACHTCGTSLDAGTSAWWDAIDRVVHCEACADRLAALAASDPPVAPGPQDAAELSPEPEQNTRVERGDEEPDAVGPLGDLTGPRDPATGHSEDERAGGSARREYERRASRERARQDQAIAEDAEWRRAAVERRPVLGRISTALTPRPTIGPEKQSTTAWRIGAEGEERVAQVLAGVAGIGVLHDRQVPRSRANIDHLAIGPGGVFVIDAKKYKEGSEVEVRNAGTRRRPDLRLHVGGRNRTALVEGVHRQMEVVRTVLGPDHGVPVHGVLCFIGATWGWRRRPGRLGDVTAIWPLGLPDLVAAVGTGPITDVEMVTAHLAAGLHPAR